MPCRPRALGREAAGGRRCESGSQPSYDAEHDRGDHPRLREEWHALLARSLDVRTYEPYALTLAGRALWRMFHCRVGQRAQSAPR